MTAAAGTTRRVRDRTGARAEIARVEDYSVGRFEAMGSPCEVLVDTEDRREAAELVTIARGEAVRIERKFSRYRDDSIVHTINGSAGQPVAVDEETSLMIDYAAACTEMSDGMFDITSGSLRRVWRFDGGEHVPSEEAVRAVLCNVGWHRVTWTGSAITMPEGMEIDLGGIGKEYAVDRAATLLAARTTCPFLVNFGGDIYAGGPRRNGAPWVVGVDDPDRTGKAVLYRIDLTQGGLATSGDARRYVMCNGRRLGHILNPKTGWPVEGAPRAVTVLAPTCLEAGSLATLAILKGPGARELLEEQQVPYRLM
jgi:FAD:protein FMN transferase